MNLPEAIICDSDEEIKTDKINAILIGPGLGTSDKALVLWKDLTYLASNAIDASGINSSTYTAWRKQMSQWIG